MAARKVIATLTGVAAMAKPGAKPKAQARAKSKSEERAQANAKTKPRRHRPPRAKAKLSKLSKAKAQAKAKAKAKSKLSELHQLPRARAKAIAKSSRSGTSGWASYNRRTVLREEAQRQQLLREQEEQRQLQAKLNVRPMLRFHTKENPLVAKYCQDFFTQFQPCQRDFQVQVHTCCSGESGYHWRAHSPASCGCC